MMNWAFTFVVLAIPLYLSGLVVLNYAKATGTVWERSKAAFSGSLTIFWARVNTVSLSLIGFTGDVSGWLGAPGIQPVADQLLGPKALIGYALLIAIGSEITRRRTLKSE